MKGEVFIQNIFNLFIIAIILEASIMAVFSMAALKDLTENRALQGARDAIILILSLVLCYKVEILNIFVNTGVRLPHILDTIISALVLMRLTTLIRDFFHKIKMG
ncbi:MAG: hypothetical protein MUD12_08945 [Spirochaetes bacterium]|jgi:hypothetical protein|nr:hypothetical protein [Spirochaetota bacterium]